MQIGADMSKQPTRWIIEAKLKLTSPLHLGTGLEIKNDDDNWVTAIALDCNSKPYIPGSSLKGALRALAAQHNYCTEVINLFGDLEVVGEETRSSAGQAEFYNAWYTADQSNNNLTIDVSRIAIDRVTGTAEDKKLFQTCCVNPGAVFDFKIIVQNASQDEIAYLLGLLNLAAESPEFSLGAYNNQGQGRIAWVDNKFSVKKFAQQQAEKWFQALKQNETKNQYEVENWQVHATCVDIDAVSFNNLSKILTLPLNLKFHTPFLVKQKGAKDKNEADAVPRRNHSQQIILPASSLRGRLRTQTERILRTLCQDVPQGHQASAYQKQKPHTDLVTLLFGTTGWKGIIQTNDCVASNKITPETLPRHEMVAIDRFTGGGKDGAKFNVDYVECPELTGNLGLNIKRLKNAQLKGVKNALEPALGLITLLLRDLAEGDIPFGFGVNKGYGQCREDLVLSKWEAVLPTLGDNLTIETVLSSFRVYLNNSQPNPQPTALNLSSIKGDGKNTLENLPQPADYEAGNFHNPYHFIPLNEPDTTDWPEIKSEKLIEKGHSHDRYQGFSGKIICQLTTKTPLFIGSKSTSGGDNRPTQIDAFIFQKKHAIPATSLRGMISSLFESISGSNFRVLHPQSYSMRKSFDDGNALSAMGRIVTAKDGKLKLQPLTLPTLSKRNEEKYYKIPEKWINVFGDNTPLRIYFDSSGSYHDINHQKFSMKIKRTLLNEIKIITENNTASHFPLKVKNSEYESHLLGQHNQDLQLFEFEKINSRPKDIQKQFTSGGWIRTLRDSSGQDSLRKDLPTKVKHFVFLPETPGIPLLDIEDAKKRFHELADLALAGMHLKDAEKKHDHEIRPYTPIGRRIDEEDRPEKDQSSDTRQQNGMPRYATRLKEGDLVFFDVDKETSKVIEISFSSIWRTGIDTEIGSEIRLQTTADLLKNSDKNLLPLGMDKSMQNRDSKEDKNEDKARNQLSPAELLFGVVDYRDSQKIAPKPFEQQAFSYAGKVRIGFGLPTTNVSLEQNRITLKELASPKPPSPALYLKNDNDDYLSKTMVASDKTGSVKLRGRKYYLHAWRTNNEAVKLDETGKECQNGTEPWVSKFNNCNDVGNKRRASIQPIRTGNTFLFEIDFNNLNETELAQLCATLKPSSQFEHRLGMGKPLGLGSVKIVPLGLYLTNRKQRYATDTLNAPRYHAAWQNKNMTKETWPVHYHHEKCADTIAESNFDFSSFACKGLPDAENIKRALALFGDPKMTVMPVHYPQQIDGLMEQEQFKWFMNNDDKKNSKKQCLKSITSDSIEIPKLYKNQKPN